jgi:hypothetical protein
VPPPRHPVRLTRADLPRAAPTTAPLSGMERPPCCPSRQPPAGRLVRTVAELAASCWAAKAGRPLDRAGDRRQTRRSAWP